MQDFHSHSWHEIFYFHGGECTYLIGNRVYRLEPGDLLLMYGMTLHRPTVPAGSPYMRSIIHFDPEPYRTLKPYSHEIPVLQPFEELRNYRLQLQASTARKRRICSSGCTGLRCRAIR